MGVFHNFILSTTPTLEGYAIKKYYGTVTSHVVTGTGFFSDFAAGMSDIFGGRSASYQKQLISIKEEILERLKNEAMALGANGIVGLKIDFDEISGKAKSMFMVSALGTAVLLHYLGEKDGDDLKNRNVNQVSSDKLNLEIEKISLIKSLSNNNYRLSNKDWEYIREHAISEVFESVFHFVNKVSENWSESDDSYHSIYVEYLKALPDEFLNLNIYKLFNANHPKIRELAFLLISERELLNIPELKYILNSKGLMAKKYALKTLYNCDKRFYTKEDIVEFEEIKNMVKNNFPEVGERISKKKLISSTEVENWICPSCKKENANNDKICKKCGSDIRGFFEKDINPEDVIEDIDNKLNVLRKIFF